MAGNLIGEPLKPYVREQIKTRQKVHGKKSRTIEEISYLNSRNAWIKMASGVVLSKDKYKEVTKGIDVPSLGANQDDDGGLLAKNWVLFNGLAKYDGRDDAWEGDRAGISENGAYGVGGSEYGYSPMPGIVNVTLKCINRGSIKKVVVDMVAHNTNQFNVIDALYLRLGYSVFIEWGYDKYIDNDDELQPMGLSLIDEKFFSDRFNKSNYSKWIPLIEKKRIETDGNYDGIFGTISNFSWTFEDDGSYKIKVEIISLGDVVESLKVNLPPVGVITTTVSTINREDRINKYTDSTFSTNENDFYSLVFPKLESDLRLYYDTMLGQYKQFPNSNTYNMEANLTTLHEPPNKYIASKYKGYVNIVHRIASNKTEFDEVSFIYFETNYGEIDVKVNNLFGSSETNPEDKKHVNDNIRTAIEFALTSTATTYLNTLDNWNKVPSHLYNYGLISKFGNNNPTNPAPYITPYFNYKGEPDNNIGGVINMKKGLSSIVDEVDDVRPWYQFWNKEDRAIGKPYSNYLTRGNIRNPQSYKDTRDYDFVGSSVNTSEMAPGGPWGKGEYWYKKIFTYERLKTWVFRHFETLNLAGGNEDLRSSQNTNPDETEEVETDDNANLNRITKHFYNIRDWRKTTISKGDYVGYTVWLKEDRFGEAMPHLKASTLKLWNEVVQFPKYGSSVVRGDMTDFVHLRITPEKQNMFIKLKTLLEFIEKVIVPKIEDQDTPLMTINTELDTNICYINENIISTDISKCLVRNDEFYNGNTTEKLFKGIAVFKFEKSGWNYGKFMNLYFNFQRVIEIFKNVDNKGSVSFFSVLKNLCEDMNECLGNINNFEPVIKEDNQIRIIDQTPIPGMDSIYTSLNITKPVVLEVFGYNQESKEESGYTSNFVHKIGITTEINKKYATMITIGATSQGSIPGLEATAFSKWNIGIKDRFKNNIVDAVESQPAGSPLNKLRLQNKSVRNEYRDLIATPLFKLGLDLNYTISTDKISTNKTVISNYYKYFQAFTSIKGGEANSSVGFLPFNLKIDMDGIGGIQIYNKLQVNTSFLPSNYPDTLDFMITGVNHKISKNSWVTHLDTIATNKQKSIQTIKDPTTHEVIQLPPPGVSGTASAPTSGYVNGERCSRPATYPRELVIENGIDLTTKPDDKYLKKIDIRSKIFDKWWDDWKNTSTQYCAQYTWNAAKYFHNKLRDSSITTSTLPKVTLEGSGGNAKEKHVHDRYMSELGYARYHLGSSLSKAELLTTIQQLYVLPGDVLTYWDNEGLDGGLDNYQVFGHICIWGGTNKTLSIDDRWISDVKYGPFCYPSKPGNCWQLYFLRAPLIESSEIKILS